MFFIVMIHLLVTQILLELRIDVLVLARRGQVEGLVLPDVELRPGRGCPGDEQQSAVDNGDLMEQ